MVKQIHPCVQCLKDYTLRRRHQRFCTKACREAYHKRLYAKWVREGREKEKQP